MIAQTPCSPVALCRITLTLAFKKHIIQEAEAINSLKATGQKYDVSASQICRWRKSFKKALRKNIGKNKK
jgi:transposase-like protein